MGQPRKRHLPPHRAPDCRRSAAAVGGEETSLRRRLYGRLLSRGVARERTPGWRSRPEGAAGGGQVESSPHDVTNQSKKISSGGKPGLR